jgi:F-type H+-transporting ATPase subunit delta
MSYDAIGRRYARAIFELGKDSAQGEAVAEQFARFAATYAASDELTVVLENPLVEPAAREAIVNEIGQRLGANQLTLRALRLITRQRRLRALPDIARHLQRFVDEDAKMLRAHATTAAPVGKAFLDKLKAELERATGNRVVLSHSVDPTLIGGVITTIGDRVVDGSLRSRLASFREGAQPAT